MCDKLKCVSFVRSVHRSLLLVFLLVMTAFNGYSGNLLWPYDYSLDYAESDSTISNDDKMLPVEKPWRAINLAYDAGVYNCSTTMDWLWEGSPGAYPNIFHTADGSSMPHTFTFDLGRVYPKLVQMDEWGRWDPKGRVFANPTDFDVWGIADITNAIPVIPSDNPNWESESMKKGWTLLARVKRKDDGVKGVSVKLAKDAPPVRFIRIRVKETANKNTRGMSNMSELSFWYAVD